MAKNYLIVFPILMILVTEIAYAQDLMREHLNTDTNVRSYLALGDSYTIGESVPPEDRYPVQLVNRLRQGGIALEDPVIIATTGWTTDDLDCEIKASGFDRDTFDFVSLLIGVNDQYQNKPFENYYFNFAKLLLRAVELAGNVKEHVVVISIPDYAFTPFGQNRDAGKISEELDRYNQVNKQVADYYGISYFDITPISRQGLQHPELVATDGLHPSGKMYALWVDLMLKDIMEELR
ncbi:MAG: SGNH/GDSL hydrolase family protein [Saprospiraceae bacterium]|nr:SGNH/GDSL hydrolase family protein [Saprospiraceae bacterium]